MGPGLVDGANRRRRVAVGGSSGAPRRPHGAAAFFFPSPPLFFFPSLFSFSFSPFLGPPRRVLPARSPRGGAVAERRRSIPTPPPGSTAAPQPAPGGLKMAALGLLLQAAAACGSAGPLRLGRCYRGARGLCTRLAEPDGLEEARQEDEEEQPPPPGAEEQSTAMVKGEEERRPGGPQPAPNAAEGRSEPAARGRGGGGRLEAACARPRLSRARSRPAQAAAVAGRSPRDARSGRAGGGRRRR